MLIKIRVQPGAKKSEVVGKYGDAIKIRLNAPPVDGKANDELVRFLAELLGISRSQVTLKSGHTSRTKVVIVDADKSYVSQKLILP